MIFVCLHSFNIPVMRFARVVNILHNIDAEASIEEFLSIFCDKYQVNHKQIFAVSPVLIFMRIFTVFHLLSPHFII